MEMEIRPFKHKNGISNAINNFQQQTKFINYNAQTRVKTHEMYNNNMITFARHSKLKSNFLETIGFSNLDEYFLFCFLLFDARKKKKQ